MQLFTGITVITVVFLAAAAVIIARNWTISRAARKTFLVCVIALILISAADWFCTLTNGLYPELRGLHALLIALTFAFAPMLPVAISNALFPEKFFKWTLPILVIHALFELASVLGGFVFWVDDLNCYHRGSFYFVYMIVYSLSALYLVIESLRASQIYQSASLTVLLGILTCLTVGVVIQVLDSVIRTTWPAVAMSVVLFFMFYSEMVLRTDGLTKLLNRHGYKEFLVHPPLPCAIIVIDIDDFKQINDTYGHAFGDTCLEIIAAEVKHAFIPVGLCYRTGGDEFLVVAKRHLDDIEKYIDALEERLESKRVEESRLPGVSIGIATADRECENIEAVIEAADQAMYQAKRAKKGNTSS